MSTEPIPTALPPSAQLNGPAKVAALLLAMGKPLASRLLKHFDQDELREITRSVAELGVVSMPVIEETIEEFAGNFVKGTGLMISPGDAEHLLSGLLSPEEISDIMSDVTGNSNQSIWQRLSSVSEVIFAGYLVKEHPQTGAAILSKVTPVCAAKVMGQLPRELRNEVMRRMVGIALVSEPAMRIIESTLQEDLLVNVARNNRNAHNGRMADIINKMEREQMEDVLSSLAEARPKVAEVLRGLLFTFDDIIKLPAKSRLVLFDQIPTERVVLALKGTDAGFRNAILSTLSTRARRMVETELANGSPAPHREVVKARRMIADLALEMAERGDLELNSEEDDEEIY
ncbi:flagellar motor switch protein FliG [Methylovirgula ligni]|uniref:Flagellar motor switch protein FliG n=1 Tax=Methylovirgula ligni TaxID=569860 RepID=A0A3D9Z4P0_9HYPH|nr:flagellar motor switch protein FliG [Methylovirgula ligni]QAY96185.1 flagellar motor switch protein FliG [Methylovirgula ligni]REF86119.1 flagellar motor switch protein FliG [Methylovirgula ligni]